MNTDRGIDVFIIRDLAFLLLSDIALMAMGKSAEKGDRVMKARGTTVQQPPKVKMARERYQELRQILEERRREILSEVQE